MKHYLWVCFLVIVFPLSSSAKKVCGFTGCFDDDLKYTRSSAPSYPTSSSRISNNPSSIPTRQGFGIEGLYYDSSTDFSAVKGLGRIGASFSPTNQEDSFFGTPVQEPVTLLESRKKEHKKYISQKLNLAFAFNVYDNNRDDTSQASLNLGFVGRYNKLTKVIMPGIGFSGVLGPFTYGYSLSVDQTLLEYEKLYSVPNQIIAYGVETYSLGLNFKNFIYDYSILKLAQTELITVEAKTIALMLGNWILTISNRKEDSNRAQFDFNDNSLVMKHTKYDNFYGIQYSLTDRLMGSLFYNYYLLNEVSVSLTWFI